MLSSAFHITLATEQGRFRSREAWTSGGDGAYCIQFCGSLALQTFCASSQICVVSFEKLLSAGYYQVIWVYFMAHVRAVGLRVTEYNRAFLLTLNTKCTSKSPLPALSVYVCINIDCSSSFANSFSTCADTRKYSSCSF